MRAPNEKKTHTNSPLFHLIKIQLHKMILMMMMVGDIVEGLDIGHYFVLHYVSVSSEWISDRGCRLTMIRRHEHSGFHKPDFDGLHTNLHIYTQRVHSINSARLRQNWV